MIFNIFSCEPGRFLQTTFILRIDKCASLRLVELVQFVASLQKSL